MNWKTLSLIIIFAACLSFIPQVQAQSILNPGLVSEVSDCGPNGTQCSLNAFLRLGLSVSQYILGIVGALTLLMFIVGGVMMMLSGGSSDKVKKGKDILFGSVVGLAIVFSSYLIIQFTTDKLLGGSFNPNLPKETQMERVGTCAKAGGKCIKGECTSLQNSVEASDCKGEESCCVSKDCENAGFFCKDACVLDYTINSAYKCKDSTQQCCRLRPEGLQSICDPDIHPGYQCVGANDCRGNITTDFFCTAPAVCCQQ